MIILNKPNSELRIIKQNGEDAVRVTTAGELELCGKIRTDISQETADVEEKEFITRAYADRHYGPGGTGGFEIGKGLKMVEPVTDIVVDPTVSFEVAANTDYLLYGPLGILESNGTFNTLYKNSLVERGMWTYPEEEGAEPPYAITAYNYLKNGVGKGVVIDLTKVKELTAMAKLAEVGIELKKYVFVISEVAVSADDNFVRAFLSSDIESVNFDVYVDLTTGRTGVCLGVDIPMDYNAGQIGIGVKDPNQTITAFGEPVVSSRKYLNVDGNTDNLSFELGRGLKFINNIDCINENTSLKYELTDETSYFLCGPKGWFVDSSSFWEETYANCLVEIGMDFDQYSGEGAQPPYVWDIFEYIRDNGIGLGVEIDLSKVVNPQAAQILTNSGIELRKYNYKISGIHFDDDADSEDPRILVAELDSPSESLALQLLIDARPAWGRTAIRLNTDIEYDYEEHGLAVGVKDEGTKITSLGNAIMSPKKSLTLDGVVENWIFTIDEKDITKKVVILN